MATASSRGGVERRPEAEPLHRGTRTAYKAGRSGQAGLLRQSPTPPRGSSGTRGGGRGKVTAFIRGDLPGCRQSGDRRGREAAADLVEVSRGRSTGGGGGAGRGERRGGRAKEERAVAAGNEGN